MKWDWEYLKHWINTQIKLVIESENLLNDWMNYDFSSPFAFSFDQKLEDDLIKCDFGLSITKENFKELVNEQLYRLFEAIKIRFAPLFFAFQTQLNIVRQIENYEVFIQENNKATVDPYHQQTLKTIAYQAEQMFDQILEQFNQEWKNFNLKEFHSPTNQNEIKR